jgi:hypothetical protein
VSVDRETGENLAETASAHGHEPDVVGARPVWIGVTVLSVLLVLGYFIPTLLENALLEREARRSPPANPLAATEGRKLPPAPRLQVNPARDIDELRRAENEVLDGYGWVDAQKGIARVPIARAMAFAAEKGLPVPAQTPAPRGAAPGAAPGAASASGPSGAPNAAPAPEQPGSAAPPPQAGAGEGAP